MTRSSKALPTKKKVMENGSDDSSCSSTPLLVNQVIGDEGVVSSSCKFPMSRVRRLMEDSDVGKKSGIRSTHEAVFVINKATVSLSFLLLATCHACFDAQ